MPEIEEKQIYICHECVDDKFLKKEIWDKGKRRKCTYCKKSRKAVFISVLAELVHWAFEEHLCLTTNEPSSLEYAMLRDKESNYEWIRSGDPVDYFIQVCAGVDVTIASDVQNYLSMYFGGDPSECLEEDPYGQEACYIENSPDRYAYEESWSYFELEITSRARYFSKFAEEILDKLFFNLNSLETLSGNPVIRVAGPATEVPYVFRARVAQTNDSLHRILKEPVKELAAPPPEAAKHGRMNAAGISVCYGATNAETCIAEVRPPVGSRVVVGRFQILRDIRLLDLNILSEIYVTGSYFDPDYKDRKGRAAFLQNLVGKLTKPIMPNDETFGYLPTQFVAEYLANKVKPRLDGIIFNSSQTKGQGQNIVLFQNSCMVEPYNLPKGTIVEIHYDYEGEISITEKFPKKPSKPIKSKFNSTIESHNNLQSNRTITLRLDLKKDVKVMEIEGVIYHKSIIKTSRSMRENCPKGNLDFDEAYSIFGDVISKKTIEY